MPLEDKREIESLDDLLGTFSLTGKVEFGDILDLKSKKITIPHSYKNFNGMIGIGAILLFLEIKNLEENIVKEIDDYANELLIENELKQLKNIFQYLLGYNKSKSSFGNTETSISNFLDELSKTTPTNSSLWSFIKHSLQEKNQYNSFTDFIEEYLNFKSFFLEETHSQEDETFGGEDDDSYTEHNGHLGEQVEGEDKGVFGTLDPGVQRKYFSGNVLEKFNHISGKFEKSDTEKKLFTQKEIGKKEFNYNFSGQKDRTYQLPLDRYFLSVYDWNDSEVEVYKDNYGSIFLKFKQTCTSQIGVGKVLYYKNDYTSPNSSETIYTGNTIDISQFSSPQDIINYIRKTKVYKNVSQEDFNTGNTNKSLEKLYFSEEMDCLPANILFVSLSRSIGLQSRLIIGISAYNKIDKDRNKQTILSKNKGHTWSEVLINGTWTIFDATPIKNDEDNEQNEDGDIEENIENIKTVEQPLNTDTLEIKKPLQETQDTIRIILDEKITHPYFKSAFEHVKADVQSLVKEIKYILEQRRLNKMKQQLGSEIQKKKGKQSHGKLKITPSVLVKVSTGNPNIYNKKGKKSPTHTNNTDTKLTDLSLAIDVSGSMGVMIGNWENGTISDYAYLSLVLMHYVAKELDITFEKVVLFGDHIYEGSPKEILQSFECKNEGNTVNHIGIQQGLTAIKDSKNGATIILSDGDGESGQAFFNQKSKSMLQNNPNITILGYGLGEDASALLDSEMKGGKVPTVIDFRMSEAGIPGQAKGIPVKSYDNLVRQLRGDLITMMTETNRT